MVILGVLRRGRLPGSGACVCFLSSGRVASGVRGVVSSARPEDFSGAG